MSHPLDPAQLVQDIQEELTRPPSDEPYVVQALHQIRHMQEQLRTTPVLGSLQSVKAVAYKLNHSTFAQQYDITDALIDLIDTLYQEFDTFRTQQTQQLNDLQRQIER